MFVSSQGGNTANEKPHNIQFICPADGYKSIMGGNRSKSAKISGKIGNIATFELCISLEYSNFVSSNCRNSAKHPAIQSLNVTQMINNPIMVKIRQKG